MKAIVSMGACALLLAGCANKGDDGERGFFMAHVVAVGDSISCATAKVVGTRCGDTPVPEALIGAAAGWTSYSEKVVDARSVNAQEAREGRTVPMDAVRLRDYRVQVLPGAPGEDGMPVRVVGAIRLVGDASHVPDLVQSMQLRKVGGGSASLEPQTARVERIDGAGQFNAVGVYKIPRRLDQGVYSVESVLYMDGREVARRSVEFRIAGN